MAEKTAPFDAKALGKALGKEIEARSAKFWSDQVLATHNENKTLSITQYINAQEIEDALERIISQWGGSALEQGMVLVSVRDKNGSFVTSDDTCDKIIVSVAYGQEFLIRDTEYPPVEKTAETAERPPAPGQTRSKIPASGTAGPDTAPKSANKTGADNSGIKAKKIQLARELKRKLDELWINRKGLGVNFNNPGALQIELVEDSPRINKIVRELGEEKLDIKIDKKSGLVKVYYGGKIHLKWEFPEE